MHWDARERRRHPGNYDNTKLRAKPAQRNEHGLIAQEPRRARTHGSHTWSLASLSAPAAMSTFITSALSRMPARARLVRPEP